MWAWPGIARAGRQRQDVIIINQAPESSYAFNKRTHCIKKRIWLKRYAQNLNGWCHWKYMYYYYTALYAKALDHVMATTKYGIKLDHDKHCWIPFSCDSELVAWKNDEILLPGILSSSLFLYTCNTNSTSSMAILKI